MASIYPFLLDKPLAAENPIRALSSRSRSSRGIHFPVRPAGMDFNADDNTAPTGRSGRRHQFALKAGIKIPLGFRTWGIERSVYKI